MMLFRPSGIVVALAVLALQAPATTLEKLSLEEMAAKSHIVVRATVAAKSSLQRGPMVYTVYKLNVSEKLKGEAGATLDVSVPGGIAGGVRQTIAGSPVLKPATEYVVFIWKSQSGILHIIGLSQGLFDLKINSAGETVLTRGVIDAELVDKSGKEVTSTPLTLTLERLRRMIRSTEGAVR
jgi:hypothetical protein